MKGCPDSIYENQIIKLRLELPSDYPFKGPKVEFISKLWHPNIY